MGKKICLVTVLIMMTYIMFSTVNETAENESTIVFATRAKAGYALFSQKKQVDRHFLQKEYEELKEKEANAKTPEEKVRYRKKREEVEEKLRKMNEDNTNKEDAKKDSDEDAKKDTQDNANDEEKNEAVKEEVKRLEEKVAQLEKELEEIEKRDKEKGESSESKFAGIG